MTRLFSSVESVIRYLLGGAVILAIYLLCLNETTATSRIKWISEHPTLTAYLTATIGFSAYSVYRIVIWALQDILGWFSNISPPSAFKDKEKMTLYEAFSRYLLWRRTVDLDKTLDDYLHYRWAIVHFNSIAALALIIAQIHKTTDSLFDKVPNCCIWFSIIILLGFTIWQIVFLSIVEKKMFEQHNNSNKHASNRQKDEE